MRLNRIEFRISINEEGELLDKKGRAEEPYMTVNHTPENVMDMCNLAQMHANGNKKEVCTTPCWES